MDRKSIIVLVVSFGLLVSWPFLMNRLYPPKPIPRAAQTNNLSSARPGDSTNLAELTAAPTNATASTSAPAPVTPAAASRPSQVSLTAEEVLMVENSEARYTFTSHGGGLKWVELKNYPETVGGWMQKASTNDFATLNTGAPLPALAILGSENIFGDGIFKLQRDGDAVRAEKELPGGLVVQKEFLLRSNYLLSASVRFLNRGPAPIQLPPQDWVVGTATLMDPQDDGSLLGAFWYDGSSASSVAPGWFQNRTLGCFPGTPRELYVAGQGNVNWAAVHNQFFALAVIPPTNVMASQVAVRQIPLPATRHASNLVGGASAQIGGRAWLLAHDDLRDAAALLLRLRNSPDSLARYLHDQLAAETRKLLGDYSGAGPLPAPLLQSLTSDLNRVLQEKSLFDANRDFFSRFTLSPATRRLVDEARWQEDVVRLNRLILEETFPREIKKSPTGYQASVLFPGSTLAANQNLQREFLIYAGPKEYKTLSRLASDLRNDIDRLMEYGGFFGWFAQLLLLSMNGLHSFGLDYGSAIIVITIIIKILFWPLTNLSTRSMKRMAALQPQMKVIQEKYKDDPQKMQRKMMEFYKEHKINPASGCLPVLIQMPIFFGFYQMIRTAIELRGARFLWNYDLSKPDTLFMIPGLDLPFNLLPLIMGATMVWQARLTPVSPGVDPMQQKIMKYMPLMFLALLYNFSAGLTLYWTVQNLLSIVQMKLTRSKDQSAAAAPAPSPVTPPSKKRK